VPADIKDIERECLPWLYDQAITPPAWFTQEYPGWTFEGGFPIKPTAPLPQRRGRPISRDTRMRRAAAHVARVPGAVSGRRGHNVTFHLACTLVNGFGLDRHEALELLGPWNETCEPPWEQRDLEHKVDDALRQNYDNYHGYLLDREDDRYRRRGRGGPRPAPPPQPLPGGGGAEPGPDDQGDGGEPIELPSITNYVAEDQPDGSVLRRPKMPPVIDADLRAAKCEWPKRVGANPNEAKLFVVDASHNVVFLDNPKAVDSFLLGGWGSPPAHVAWHRGLGFVSFETYCEYLRSIGDLYVDIHNHPHWPPVPGIYYAYPPIDGPGDGAALGGLLDFFHGLETEDRSLIKAFILTLFWGGLPGKRPGFLFSAADNDGRRGRGVGKTALVDHLSSLVGGSIDIALTTDADKVKTRLLSPGAQTTRVVRVDNVKMWRLSSGEYEGLITAETISGHRLYVAEARRPNLLVWAITVNGPSSSQDMADRLIPIRLDRPPSDPAWDDKVKTFIARHRDAILADVRALLTAPMPTEFVPASRWAAWEKAVLSKVFEPEACQQVIRERQEAMNADSEDAGLVREIFYAKIRGACFDPERAVLRISTAKAAEWYREAVNDRNLSTGKSTTALRGAGVPELSYDPHDGRYRTMSTRFWIWRGPLAPLSQEPVQGQIIE
jgi:hypothetical protein